MILLENGFSNFWQCKLISCNAIKGNGSWNVENLTPININWEHNQCY